MKKAGCLIINSIKTHKPVILDDMIRKEDVVDQPKRVLKVNQEMVTGKESSKSKRVHRNMSCSAIIDNETFNINDQLEFNVSKTNEDKTKSIPINNSLI